MGSSGDDRGHPELRRWLEYLRAMGVRDLHLPADWRRPGAAGSRERPVSSAVTPRPTPRPQRTKSAPPRARAAAAPAVSAPGPAPAPPAQGRLLDTQPGFTAPRPADPGLRLAQVREELGECTRCKLHSGRTNIVFGVGDPQAGLMFIGEGPGADEDAQGEPFVGRAGKKLDEMIAAIGLRREEVYIANIVKCRPPNNRDPERDEVDSCWPFLLQQIEAIRPRVIVTLGSPATRVLLDTRAGITKLRGHWQDFRGIPVMPTFHPAYLLRAYTKANRGAVWDDLKAAKARLDAFA